MVHVQPGRSEDGNPREDCKGEQVEAGSYIGHHVQTEAKFQGVHLGIGMIETSSRNLTFALTGFSRRKRLFTPEVALLKAFVAAGVYWVTVDSGRCRLALDI